MSDRLVGNIFIGLGAFFLVSTSGCGWLVWRQGSHTVGGLAMCVAPINLWTIWNGWRIANL